MIAEKNRMLQPSLLEKIESQLLLRPRGEEDLRDYQNLDLIPFLIEHPRSAAYVDMGMGKTISILTLIDRLFWMSQVNRVLIIGPKRVIIQTWPAEIKDWRHLSWMDYSLIRPNANADDVKEAMKVARKHDPLSPGNAANRAKTQQMRYHMEEATDHPALVHLINREQVVWLVNYWAKKRIWPYDCIIIDESTSFADHRSQRFKHLLKVAFHSKRLHLLSGTPAPEGIEDLFAQCYLLDQGKRFGKTITGFRKRFMDHNRWTNAYVPLPGAVERVAELMSDIAIVIKDTRHSDTLFIERPVVMDRKHMARYKKFEDELVLDLPDGQLIEAVNAGSLWQKLLQFASGNMIQTEIQEDGSKPKRIVHHLHDAKIETLREIIEENKGTPLLVAYWFKSSLADITRAFKHATVMDANGACVGDWNDGAIPLLLLHPASAGHGLNMQLGPGHILVFYDIPVSLELYQQTIKRIDRPGQKRPVRVILMSTRGTVDADTSKRLIAKQSLQDFVVNYIRKKRKMLQRRRAAAAL